MGYLISLSIAAVLIVLAVWAARVGGKEGDGGMWAILPIFGGGGLAVIIVFVDAVVFVFQHVKWG